MISLYAGLTSQSIDVFIPDSASTAGAGKTGLAYNSASLVAYYRKGAAGSPVAITLATLANAQAAYSSGGFVEVDATNMPGQYRLDIPNAAIDTAGLVHLMLKGASGMAPVTVRIDCRPLPVDVKQWGGSNIATPTVAGVPEVDITHVGGSAATGTSTVDANVVSIETDAITAASIAADAISEIQSGLATAAALTVIDDLLDTEVAAIKAKTDNLPADPADASDIAASFAALNTKVDTIDDFLDTEVAAIKAKTDNLPTDPADQSAVEAAISAAWTTAMTESYSVDESPPTPAQALLMILQMMTEMSISGTTMTIKRLDGSTTAFTLTLNSATLPTGITRAT